MYNRLLLSENLARAAVANPSLRGSTDRLRQDKSRDVRTGPRKNAGTDEWTTRSLPFILLGRVGQHVMFVTAWDVAGALVAERTDMDFIERWFGVSPDGGGGSIELMYLIVLIIVVVALLYRPVLKRFFGKRRRRLS